MISEIRKAILNLFLRGVTGHEETFLGGSSGCGNGPPGVFQFGCAQSAEYKYQHGQHGYTEPPPDRAAIEAELTKIENDWPRIIKEHDAAAVRKMEAMTRFSFTRTGQSATSAGY